MLRVRVLIDCIDVVEPNADPTGQTVGTKLIVDAEHQYSDLDEVIVNHVQAMARKVEELMAHEKFKHGSEDDLRTSHTSLGGGTSLIVIHRYLPEELRRRKPSEERVWLHPEPETPRALQSVLLGEQKLHCSDMGTCIYFHMYHRY